jgi:glutamyl-tRNA synthetase
MINSLTLDQNEVDKRIQRGDDYVIRFKTPKNETLHLTDMIRGNIKIDTNILDDKVLFKSDGMPTYHLANIVDDYLMKITHVIRGEEWLPSLALHKQLYDALGWEAPEFAHLPLILKPTGKGKLSKRDGDKLGFPVFPLEWIDPKTNEISKGYKEDGYFKEAVVNFLALLGWNPGTEQEHFAINDLVKEFSIEKVNKSGARFDPEKIKWFNHYYMQNQPSSILAQNYKESKPKLKNIDVNYLELVIDKVKERANFISDFDDLTDYFFNTPEKYDEKALKKAIKPDTEGILKHITAIIKDIDDEKFEANYIQSQIKNWITNEGVGFGKVMMPLRLALVGSLKGPDVFEIAFFIGKNETIKRIKNLLLNI